MKYGLSLALLYNYRSVVSLIADFILSLRGRKLRRWALIGDITIRAAMNNFTESKQQYT